MPNTNRTLEDAVLEVFEAACEQQDFEVAEHLLRALEVIAHRAGNEVSLEPAMLMLKHSLLENRCHS